MDGPAKRLWALLLLSSAACAARADMADSWRGEAGEKHLAVALPRTWVEVAAGADSEDGRCNWLRLLLLARGMPQSEEELAAYQPVGAHGHVIRAFALLAHGRPQEALAEADASAACEHSTHEAHLARANALLALKRYSEAADASGAYIAVAPFNPEGWRLRAEARKATGDATGADEDLRHREALFWVAPGDPDRVADPTPRARPDWFLLEDDMVRWHGFGYRPRWGRWCCVDYRDALPSLLRKIVSYGACYSWMIPLRMAAYYGPDAAREAILEINRTAYPGDPEYSVRSLLGDEWMVPWSVDRWGSREQVAPWLRALLRESTNDSPRIEAACGLARLGDLRPEDIAGLSLTPVDWQDATRLAEAYRFLGDQATAKRLEAGSRDLPARDAPATPPWGHTRREVAVTLSRALLPYTDTLNFHRLGGYLGACAEALNCRKTGVPEWARDSEGYPASLFPAADLAVPPTPPDLPLVGPVQDPPAESDEQLAARLGLAFLEGPEAEARVAAIKRLRSLPEGSVGPAVPFLIHALLRGVLAGDLRSEAWAIRMVKRYAPRESSAYQLAIYESLPALSSLPTTEWQAVGDLWSGVGTVLAMPWNQWLEDRCADCGPKTREYVSEQVRKAREAEEARRAKDPDLWAVLYGRREESLAAGRRIQEQGHPLGELVARFWTEHPEFP